jgi:hypothetical protein
MFKTFEAFLLGMTELRCAFTTCMHSWDENQAYDP